MCACDFIGWFKSLEKPNTKINQTILGKEGKVCIWWECWIVVYIFPLMCLVLKPLLLGSCCGMMSVYMPTRGIPGLGSFMESIKTHTPVRGEKLICFKKIKVTK